ncbi:MAG: helix-turn-helix transcriptional regulator [Sandaracinaceae bacterium]|nr:helix-turn-helix transcriptional regulator [Sandaracinaceae bacterium]
MSAASRKSPSPARQKPAGRPPGSDSERSHDALLAAARLHFARRGFGPANVREIAEAAGYTTSTLYHYFGDKQGLVRGGLSGRRAAHRRRLSSRGGRPRVAPGTPARAAGCGDRAAPCGRERAAVHGRRPARHPTTQ